MALHNVRLTCPELSTYMINTYRKPSKLFVNDVEHPLLSQEGTTQGDVPALGIYSCSTMPLVNSLQHKSEKRGLTLKQVWYADDAASGGTLSDLRLWWDELLNLGPLYGYFPKASKTWLIVKPEFEEEARKKFAEVNVTTEGHKYLGSFIGTAEGVVSRFFYSAN